MSGCPSWVKKPLDSVENSGDIQLTMLGAWVRVWVRVKVWVK